MRLPIWHTAGRAYILLGQHLGLHAKAIWPPIVFLAGAEFLYHKAIGNADTVSAKLQAAFASPWYFGFAALAWLTGLKFLLSFSISWRRHLLLNETFDPFFFKKPFWRYLAFLVLTYVWLVGLGLLTAGLGSVLRLRAHYAWVMLAIVPVAFALWAIVRQLPFFTSLSLDDVRPGWRDSVRLMRGNALRYAVAWVAAMIPLVAANALLDLAVDKSGVNVGQTAVALGESAFRQAVTFLHFSLGASIGALTYTALTERLPEASYQLWRR